MSEKTLKEKAEEILEEKNTKLTSDKLLSDMTVFGVTGSIEHKHNSGKVVTWNDSSMQQNISTKNNGSTFRVYIPFVNTESNPNGICYTGSANIDLYVNSNIVANAINLTANKIKAGENILGITGTYGGSTSNTITLADTVLNIYQTMEEWDEETGDVIPTEVLASSRDVKNVCLNKSGRFVTFMAEYTGDDALSGQVDINDFMEFNVNYQSGTNSYVVNVLTDRNYSIDYLDFDADILYKVEIPRYISDYNNVSITSIDIKIM